MRTLLHETPQIRTSKEVSSSHARAWPQHQILIVSTILPSSLQKLCPSLSLDPMPVSQILLPCSGHSQVNGAYRLAAGFLLLLRPGKLPVVDLNLGWRAGGLTIVTIVAAMIIIVYPETGRAKEGSPIGP